MNALLGLIRLRVNLYDTPAQWAKLIGAYQEVRPAGVTFDEPADIAPNGLRTFSLRMHPVPVNPKKQAPARLTPVR